MPWKPMAVSRMTNLRRIPFIPTRDDSEDPYPGGNDGSQSRLLDVLQDGYEFIN